MLKDIFPRDWFENYEKIKNLFDNEYGYPEFDTLRYEICKCLILDLNMASITLTNHLLEDFLKKMLIYKNASKEKESIIGIFDLSTDKYNSINLNSAIECACIEELITEEQKVLFHQFRNDFRNPYSHADSKKIFENMTIGAQELKLEGENIRVSEYQQIDLLRLPIIHGFAKAIIAKQTAFEYFKSVDTMIREILKKNKTQKNNFKNL